MPHKAHAKSGEQHRPARPRRGVRISLRMLLVFVAVTAALFNWMVVPAMRQRAAREWLDNQRAEYSFNTPRPGADDWLVAVVGIDAFSRVTVVHFGTREIYDLQPLAGLAGLEELYINQFVHPQVDFGVLKSLRRLRRIELTTWSGVGRKQLRAMAEQLPRVEIISEEFPQFATEPAFDSLR